MVSSGFSSAARLALTAFDDLLSRVRGESAEDKAANALRAKLRMRRAEKGKGGEKHNPKRGDFHQGYRKITTRDGVIQD